ncbi:hypothetical protein J5Y09_00995 [Roseomonas sp. PWR1]|uniref:Major facilitator superfamily (MFS) profile domain-containing protein n=1 Tax=Roseomonas nitratireducens TaxID=2820810 RepID=A0ABS4AM98_9PROT|nr:hypothetical protein [Neoroseomonas nitratireducens]MBP0462474.1 hypothetical protein [Neoroseomonas nitratireducens]
MNAPLRAGLVYGATMFGVGFLLGPLRVLVLEPALGAALAVAAEAVPMLVAMLLIAPRVARAQGVVPQPGPRLAMGLVALAPVLTAEVVMALGLGRFGEWIAAFATPAGLIGLGLLVALALVPLLRR